MAQLLTIIPCLNEAATMERLITYLLGERARCAMRIVVSDGGSTDGTVEIVQRLAAVHPCVTYLPNPKRIQSAAVNAAVALYGQDADYLLRIDAHADYPPGFCRDLVDEAVLTGADSVVVAMRTVAPSGFAAAVAAAQNSPLGNGGSAHRSRPGDGQFVDHGHHALMRVAAFRTVGGYDESFSHNEDAELDMRLRKAGFRLWLTGKTSLDYHPRGTVGGLFRQYRNYGRGRARTLLKHRARPRLRQLLPVAIAPCLVLAPLGGLLPLLLWALLCMGYGLLLAMRARRPLIVLSGPAAMVMHAAWSLGFWQALMEHQR
ncbi:MAG: glycosyltransferase family 2 protein [Pseudomonadota bacterium]